MLKLTYAQKSLPNCQNSLFFYTWNLGLFIGFLMWLENAKDPGSLGIHDLFSESLGIPSFLSSKQDLFLNIQDLSSIPNFQGLDTIYEP
jgi:hypothetical protein